MAAYDPTDPRELTPQQRLDALTAVLAVGAARLLAFRFHDSPACANRRHMDFQSIALPAPRDLPPPPSPESSQIRLDVSRKSRLHVPRG
jgi:hypothetical protein